MVRPFANNDPYNIFSPKTRGDHALLARLRRDDPVYSTTVSGWGTRHWFLSRFEDCDSFLRDNRFGRDLHNTLPDDLLEHWPKPPEVEQAFERHVLGVDPPEHTRMRGLVHKAFTPKVIRNLTERVQDMADQIINSVKESGEMDLLEQYAFPIPITLISEMLGVPVEERNRFRDWVRRIFSPGDTPDRALAGMEFMQYMNERIAERREEPRDDLLSGLVRAREDDDSLTHQELLSMILLLLTAGFETTVHLITSGVYLMLTHPDQYDLFRGEMDSNDDLVKSAMEEIVRYEGPASANLLRWAYDDVEIGGQTIQHGDSVTALLLAANRDPDQFDDPDVFDITRSPNNHLGFGAGVHYCLGAPLARMEGAVALPTLFRRLPDIQIAVDPELLRWDETNFHGLSQLPVRF